MSGQNQRWNWRRFLFSALCPVLMVLPGLALAIDPILPPCEPCRSYATSVVVVTSHHELHLCENGRSVDRWPVALGLGGINKRVAGDHKTPLGSYPLAQPRPSQNFKLFIPVGYPTLDQRRRGYTGDAIGLHGPLRQFKDAGEINVVNDWTWGCIAVSSDAIIEEIARWVRSHPNVVLHIK